jgi:hypothetical protein
VKVKLIIGGHAMELDVEIEKLDISSDRHEFRQKVTAQFSLDREDGDILGFVSYGCNPEIINYLIEESNKCQT